MKKLTHCLVVTAIAVCSFSVAAEDIDSSDPCTVTVCMYGKVTGTAGSQCDSAVRKFFTINVVKKGIFMPWETLNARKKFLAGCSSADPASVNNILDRYGKSR